jgi:hypothetical protein
VLYVRAFLFCHRTGSVIFSFIRIINVREREEPIKKMTKKKLINKWCLGQFLDSSRCIFHWNDFVRKRNGEKEAVFY